MRALQSADKAAPDAVEIEVKKEEERLVSSFFRF